MDRRERSGEPITAMLAALQGWQAGIWTALPGIIQSYDVSKQTCTILPAVKSQVQNPDGSFDWVMMPLLLDCPVVFPSGGGVLLTFPLVTGDECLVVFAARCIDNWWQKGGAQEQAELRLTDLSDGFCIPGPRSVPNVAPAISTTKAQLRNTAGTTYLELDPATGKMAIHAPELDVVAPTINITGTINLTGSLTATGDVVGQGTSLHNHTHTSASPGSPTSPPL